ncbi:RHS repeat-associated core domain-containing protein [Tuwongella immobilis]|uniref:RHS repeat-associated core domain-containing protein n=1 Tax=Tuwongella immobilis TaxID=692036 RepID=A0A6C2YHG0_9BACT|nr:RHS repeat-associated core domain-containing protein [Tuwongella immobilis]VIP00926.1 rhs repeat-associated core domain-containing protein : Uncultured bacterium genome assembly Metasoil_fosmids_resub OS=uncultured bacterium PE=4 SV=1 [Tuwongella immobilis]VTR97270.1 rhs repeat-associated core domain-containing protein : Uncultured bacterium genome assembly Metasoil_fosmids_resub OS=uncultured bacterium PE=4 SV=1 [Tuwongella immobilis]
MKDATNDVIRPLWQGLRLDDASGLYHARNRDVSTTLGRPLQRDPIGFAAGDVNVYRWLGNGPMGLVDPLGLFGIRYFILWGALRLH